MIFEQDIKWKIKSNCRKILKIYPKILIPMIRRTFPELITSDIVGVQPLSGPVGLAFQLKFSFMNVKSKIKDTCQKCLRTKES